MRNSSKGFGLLGVFAAVVFLIVTAVVSASAKADTANVFDQLVSQVTQK